MLKKVSPKAVIAILETHLLNFLKLEAEAMQKPEYEFSSWWRNAIEDTEQDILNTYKDRMLAALRDTIEAFARVHSDDEEHLILRYLDAQHSIFRRLGLYILCRFPDRYSLYVSRELLKRENLDDSEIHHEYFVLLQQGFPRLSLAEQQSLVSSILEGSDAKQTEDLAEWVQRERGIDRETYISIHRKTWIRDGLWMIKDYLDDHTRQALSALVLESGEPEHPAFLAWSSGVHSVRDVSPFTEQTIAEMPPHELAELLKKWQPEPNRRFGP